MKIRNTALEPLRPNLARFLGELRAKRKFDVDLIIDAKCLQLNTYMTRYGLKGCVIAVSGGIDSAVVLSLVHAASKQPDSPIQKISAVLLPVSNTNGVTNQDTATERGLDLCNNLGIDPHVIDLEHVHDNAINAVHNAFTKQGTPWAVGQVASTLRTPVLYYVTSLMAENGFPSILIGTTNRDEGAFMGYIGKASDGMVDLQLISDLHKSEIYAIARELKVPDSILNVAPTGDMFDSSTDEEVFGTTYDCVELFHLFYTKEYWDGHTIPAYFTYPDDHVQWHHISRNVCMMNHYNHHKYMGRSPAVHLDILESHVSVDRLNSWDNRIVKDVKYTMPTNSRADVIEYTKDFSICDASLISENATQLALANVIKSEEFDDFLEQCRWIQSGSDGHIGTGGNGSYRASLFSETLANTIWQSIRSFLNIKILSEKTARYEEYATSNRIWRPIGVNPLFRFIRYAPGNKLVVHYDERYKLNTNVQSLQSMVMYLKPGSPTRFIDPKFQKNKNSAAEFADWKSCARPEQVSESYDLESGSALIFDHRQMHDSPPSDQHKIIIRTDIMYERCGWLGDNC